ncbi:MAG: hypothetical protein QXR19_09405 [Candidatus Jordarchaeaceae archaeon]
MNAFKAYLLLEIRDWISNPRRGVSPMPSLFGVSDTGSTRANHNLFTHNLFTLTIKDNKMSRTAKSAVI